jgi:hypothetical protein
MFEEGEELVIDEMDLALYGAPGAIGDVVRARLCGRRYDYYYGEEVLLRAREGLEMLQIGCYVVFSFDHYGPDKGKFIKVGSTIHNPIARAYAHFGSSSPNPSNIIGALGDHYVATARFGLVVFPSAPAAARAMDRYLKRILKPLLGTPLK